jgi:Domain of unknown function (DU1801)
MKFQPFQDLGVAAIFDNSPKKVRKKLMLLRQLIFNTAKSIKEVGELEETLKWNQPSYLTTKSKSGSMIRIDKIKNQPDKYAIYFLCQTTLVDSFREIFGEKFIYEGTRAIYLDANDEIPFDDLKQCISMALTYRLGKKNEFVFFNSGAS